MTIADDKIPSFLLKPRFPHGTYGGGAEALNSGDETSSSYAGPRSDQIDGDRINQNQGGHASPGANHEVNNSGVRNFARTRRVRLKQDIWSVLTDVGVNIILVSGVSFLVSMMFLNWWIS